MDHGLSPARPLLSVETTALMGSDFGALANALAMSAWERGEPVLMERLACGWRESGRRTRAVTVWERDKASARTEEPVRPLAPRRKIRMVRSDSCVFALLRYGTSRSDEGLSVRWS